MNEIERLLFVDDFELKVFGKDRGVPDCNHLNLVSLVLILILVIDVIRTEYEIFGAIKLNSIHFVKFFLACVGVAKGHHLFVDFYTYAVEWLSYSTILLNLEPLREIVSLLLQLYVDLVKNMVLLFLAHCDF